MCIYINILYKHSQRVQLVISYNSVYIVICVGLSYIVYHIVCVVLNEYKNNA